MMIAEQQEGVLGMLKLKESNSNTLDYDFDLTNFYATVNGFAGKLRKTGFQKLRQNQNVLKIYKPFRIRALLNESAKVVNADKAWGLTFNSENITGKGETICIPDTGVNYTHAALGGCTTGQFLAGSCPKVIAGYDFANDDNNPIDDNGHGTHVAGIAASADSKFRGIAPDANIAALKIFDESGGGESNDLISAIDWCVNNASRFNISVISMSLGSFESFSSHCDDDDPLLTSSISNAIANNIAVVAAAGNSGVIDGVESPGCITNVTAVGSSAKNDEVSSFSDRWALPMLFAPGESINSAGLGNGFVSLDGTSMATPHVAGAIALLRQFKRLQQGIILKPAQIGSTLISSGKLIRDTFGSGLLFPRIDIYAALLLLNQTVFTLEEEGKGLKIVDVDVKVDGRKSSNINDGEEIKKEAGPNSRVEFRITVKNDFSKNSNVKISNIAVKAAIEGVDGESDLE
ncbi:MAG: S8 family serine peptidase, partial [Nanoarchaeota archaeon]